MKQYCQGVIASETSFHLLGSCGWLLASEVLQVTSVYYSFLLVFKFCCCCCCFRVWGDRVVFVVFVCLFLLLFFFFFFCCCVNTNSIMSLTLKIVYSFLSVSRTVRHSVSVHSQGGQHSPSGFISSASSPSTELTTRSRAVIRQAIGNYEFLQEFQAIRQKLCLLSLVSFYLSPASPLSFFSPHFSSCFVFSIVCLFCCCALF